jgi:SAM-dependent methyltransferase
MANKRYNDYDPFAWLYNKHWGNMFTPMALAVIDELITPDLKTGAQLLDLCCGTGQMAGTLNDRGFQVTGIDGSDEMLTYARKNAPGVNFFAGDARSFTCDTDFDAAVCVFDSLNHIMSLDELGEVFRSVSGVLKDDGVFLFDLNMEAGYIANWHGIYGIVEDDHVCVIKNSYNQDDKTAVFDATLFRLEREWIRTDFILTQKCYLEAEVSSSLEKAGFKKIAGYEFTREKGLTELSAGAKRAFYLCFK